MAKTIRVKAANEDGRVAFFEQDAAHPSGQVFIVGNGDEVEAGETAALKRAIRDGRLVMAQTTPVARQQTPAVDTRAEPQGIKWIGEVGYDKMNVDESIDYIASLSDTEAAIVLAYEVRTRNRSTVLKAFGIG